MKRRDRYNVSRDAEGLAHPTLPCISWRSPPDVLGRESWKLSWSGPPKICGNLVELFLLLPLLPSIVP